MYFFAPFVLLNRGQRDDEIGIQLRCRFEH